jgi:hypothetical protein
LRVQRIDPCLQSVAQIAVAAVYLEAHQRVH